MSGKGELFGVSLTREDSIMVGVYRGTSIDLKLAKQLAEERIAIFANAKYPLLADTRELKSIDKEARDFFAKGRGLQGVTALAILVGNFTTSMLANLYINLSRPEVPTKVFHKREEAVKWLNKFVVPQKKR